MIRHLLGVHHMLVRRHRTALTIALSSWGALAAMAATPRNAEALTIVPLFNSNLSASSKATINTAIAFYQNTFSDPITVTIGFANVDFGLGESTSFNYALPYSSFSAALVADRTSADDATANVIAASTDPVLANTTISIKAANGRALGFNTPALLLGSVGCYNTAAAATTAVDACIGVNLAITDDIALGVAGGYGALAVFEHEMDEALGLGSTLSTGTVATNIAPEDLFRYSAPGTRAFGNHSCAGSVAGPLAYFSINQGTTNLDPFDNCDNDADYGDWAPTATAQVQDAFGTPGSTEFLTANTPEVRALDVIGYDVRVTANSTVPEPGTLGMFGMAFAALVAYRRRRNAAVA